MKKKIIALLSSLLLLLTGCQNEEQTSDSYPAPPGVVSDGDSSNTESSENSESSGKGEENSDPDLYLENFAVGYSMGTFVREKLDLVVIHEFETPPDKHLEFVISASINPDKSMMDIVTTADFYIFGDGTPLKFCLPNDLENNEYSIVHRVTPKNPSKFNFDVDIDLSLSGEIETITVICNFYPDYIPKKGLGMFGGCAEFSIRNSDCTYSLTGLDDEGNQYFDINSDGSIEVGNVSLENSDKVSEYHFYDDIVLDPQNKELYIKYAGYEKNDVPDYLILFRDGELLDVFDGRYSQTVNCLSGQRTFQFKIPESYIPDDGLHTFQAVAFPAYRNRRGDENFLYSGTSTSKVRVKISPQE